MSHAATMAVLGHSLREQGYEPGYRPEDAHRVFGQGTSLLLCQAAQRRHRSWTGI